MTIKKTTFLGNVVDGLAAYGVLLILCALTGVAFNVFLLFAGF
jgi:hypothetical protein